ncbi:E3 ubiquitin-protein ligase RING1-like [Apostasia shenzhenica]|uniref:E3 ubiquitin-protein ligase RING1-like n=1 Tax=Apostasia shenzhenica TaxID=1088818 RepID=A0A2I0A6G7_9ASPA|nr:E3 ubiquitin-protein ligase RING1-like [Apostasia shenzhenica]
MAEIKVFFGALWPETPPPEASNDSGDGGSLVLYLNYYFEDYGWTMSSTASQNLRRLAAFYTSVEHYVEMMKKEELFLLLHADLPLLPTAIAADRKLIAGILKLLVEHFAAIKRKIISSWEIVTILDHVQKLLMRAQRLDIIVSALNWESEMAEIKVLFTPLWPEMPPPEGSYDSGDGGSLVLNLNYYFEDQDQTISSTASQNLRRLAAKFTSVEHYIEMMKEEELFLVGHVDLPVLPAAITAERMRIAGIMKVLVEHFAADGRIEDVECRVDVVVRGMWSRRIRRTEMTTIYEDDDERRDELCTICLNEFMVGLGVLRTPCGHVFHGRCISQWFESAGTCPVCRFEVDIDEN